MSSPSLLPSLFLATCTLRLTGLQKIEGRAGKKRRSSNTSRYARNSQSKFSRSQVKRREGIVDRRDKARKRSARDPRLSRHGDRHLFPNLHKKERAFFFARSIESRRSRVVERRDEEDDDAGTRILVLPAAD